MFKHLGLPRVEKKVRQKILASIFVGQKRGVEILV